MIYFVLFILFLLPLYSKKGFFCSTRYFWFECIILILVSGLRYYVGGDTIGYMQMFDVHKPLNELTVLDFLLTRYQPLWILLNSTLKTLECDFYVLQFVVSILVNVSTFYLIKKETKHIFEVSFLYLLLQFLYFNCEVLRESMAACIIYFAFRGLEQKRIVQYYILVTVAFLLHDSCFFFYVLPFFYKHVPQVMKPRILIAAFICGFLLSNPLVMQLFLFLLPGNRGENFINGYATWEIGSTLGYIRSVVMLYIMYIINKRTYCHLSPTVQKGVFLYLMVSSISICMPIFIRINNYFQIFYLIMVGTFFVKNRDILLKTTASLLIIFSLYRYYLRDVSDWVTTQKVSHQYYFYELFYPYYSVFERPDAAVMTRRHAIASQDMLHEKKTK